MRALVRRIIRHMTNQVISLVSDFSVSLVATDGRVSLAHLMEFSHFVDLYVLHDAVYVSAPPKPWRHKVLGWISRSPTITQVFGTAPDSPLRELSSGALADAVCDTSDNTLAIYDSALEPRTFSLTSYDFWMNEASGAADALHSLAEPQDTLRFWCRKLDDSVERVMEELGKTKLTILPSPRNLLPFLRRFHQIDTPALTVYRMIAERHRREIEELQQFLRPRAVYLPPLLTLLLARCKSREDIPYRLAELRAEFTDFRHDIGAWLARLDEARTMKEKQEIRAELGACLAAVAKSFEGYRRGFYREVVEGVIAAAEDGSLTKLITKPAFAVAKELLANVAPDTLALRRATGLIDMLDQSLGVEQSATLLARVFGRQLDIRQSELTAARQYRQYVVQRYGFVDALTV